jgi:pyridoxine 5-phosphate synthase
MSLLLGVNIDHVATLRQARYARMPGARWAEPSVVVAGQDALEGGADSLTIHVRGDRRHMQDADAFRLKEEVDLPINLEMGVTREMVDLALRLGPRDVCLVPESREEITTEGGLDVVSGFDKVAGVMGDLQRAGIRVSLFIDPDKAQVDAAGRLGAEMIELHTGCFANAVGGEVDAELERLIRAARQGRALGLQVNAGHGINYENIVRILEIPHLKELNIGHSIVSRAMRVGMALAVSEMKTAMSAYAGGR